MRSVVLGLAAGLLLSGCVIAENRYYVPRQGFDCSEVLEKDGETFTVSTFETLHDSRTNWYLRWDKTFDGNFRLALGGHILTGDEASPGPTIHGASNVFMQVNFDQNRFGHAYFPDVKNLDVRSVVEARVGDVFVREWAQPYVSLLLQAEQIESLLQGEGDFRFKLYDATKVIQEATLPRDAIQRVIEQLKQMEARVREKAAAPAQRCEPHHYELIIVT